MQVGDQYLTRTIHIRGLFGPSMTRGMVEIEEIHDGYVKVKWLMRDGSPRIDSRLPDRLPLGRLLVPVATRKN